MLIYILLLNFMAIAAYAKPNENKCNTLYYGEMDKIMIKTQSLKTKYVMENFYKRRSKQSGLSINQIKNCYNNKFKGKII